MPQNPYQKQYDEQMTLLDRLAQEDPSTYSPKRTAIAVARMELVRGGPGNNGMLQAFLRETAEHLTRLEQELCSIPHE